MKITQIMDDVKRCDKLRNIGLNGENDWTEDEINDICNLLWDYRNLLLTLDIKEIEYRITF